MRSLLLLLLRRACRSVPLSLLQLLSILSPLLFGLLLLLLSWRTLL